MKNILIALFFLSITEINGYSQNNSQIFLHQGYAIGSLQSGGAYCTEAFMPEVILIGATYFLYYNTKYNGNESAISYATSTDLLNWTIQDTIMTGSLISTDSDYILGGPRIIQLSGGNYRMFYRTAANYITPAEPQYHIQSAISSDGINFIKEGIRIPIEPFTPGSYFTHVGHSEFYFDQGGNLSALLTAKDTTMNSMQPDRIYTAVSFDEGITWGSFVPLYESCHDPVVIIDSSNLYHAYFTYLNEGFRTVESLNGVIWPTQPDTLFLIQGTDTLTETGAPKIADLGAAVAPDGTIYIYSNYQTTLGPWTNIAYYTFGGFAENETLVSSMIEIFPNPTTSHLTILNNGISTPTSFVIFNITGQQIMQGEISDGVNIELENLDPGNYIIEIETSSKQIVRKRITIY